MGKMSELATTIEELRKSAATISEAANWLAQLFSAEDEAAEAEMQPANEPQLKLEDVRAVMADVSRKGYTAQIRELLLKYGASRLSDIDPANYGALLKEVEDMDHAG